MDAFSVKKAIWLFLSECGLRISNNAHWVCRRLAKNLSLVYWEISECPFWLIRRRQFAVDMLKGLVQPCVSNHIGHCISCSLDACHVKCEQWPPRKRAQWQLDCTLLREIKWHGINSAPTGSLRPCLTPSSKRQRFKCDQKQFLI